MKYTIFIIILSLFSCKSNKNEQSVLNTHQQDSLTLHQEFFDTGKLKYITYKKDSTVFDEKNFPCKCEELHIFYYKNGKIKEKGCQGHYETFGVPIGTWYKYDSLGNKISEIRFVHDSLKGYEKTLFFNTKGKLQKEIIVGYDPHFGELDSIWYEKKY